MHKLKNFLLFILLAFMVRAQDDFLINQYDVLIEQNESGYFDVVENLEINFFKQRRGIYRDVDLSYLVEGKRVYIDVSSVKVSGAPFKLEGNKNQLAIRIGDPDKFVTGTQTYEISYRVRGAIMTYEDHHEFYWNVIGVGWPIEIKNASFIYKYPTDWSNRINTFKASYGPASSVTNMPNLSHQNNVIAGVVPYPLAPREGLSLSIVIPKELMNDQVPIGPISKKRNPTLDKISKWAVLLPISLASFLLAQWRRLYQTAEQHIDDIAVQHYPPVGKSPLFIGTFYDGRANNRDIMALLPYWGQRGNLRIYQSTEVELTEFERVESLPTDAEYYEVLIFNEIFSKSNRVRLRDLKEMFYSLTFSIGGKVRRDIRSRALYDEAAYRIFHTGWMIAAFVFLVILGISVIAALGALIAGIGLILVGVSCLIIHFLPPKKSSKGVILHNHLKGLYKHLRHPDPDDLTRLIEENPDYLFEMYPYVIAFDHDKSWLERSGSYPVSYPPWYIPHMMLGGPMRSSTPTFKEFSDGFNPKSIERAFFTPPPSQGSSGGSFRGGGSVGGGFGGGGGRSW